jgi:hypothetical protein
MFVHFSKIKIYKGVRFFSKWRLLEPLGTKIHKIIDRIYFIAKLLLDCIIIT